MAAIITSQTAFSANEQITSAKLNNILAQSSFDAGALTGDGTLTLVSGQMQVSILKAANLPASIINQTMIGTNVVGKGATFLAFKSANQNISANAYNQITSISNISYDTDGGFSGSTSTFTASVAGYYLLMGILQSPTPSNNFQASIWINDTTAILGSQISNGTNSRTTVEGIRLLAVGDTVTLKAIASTTMTINAAEFSGCLIRSA